MSSKSYSRCVEVEIPLHLILGKNPQILLYMPISQKTSHFFLGPRRLCRLEDEGSVGYSKFSIVRKEEITLSLGTDSIFE